MSYELHAIQLHGIRVEELYVKVNDFDEADKLGLNLPFVFRTGHTQFDPEANIIVVGVQGQIGAEDGEAERGSPIIIRAHLMGQFVVDPEKFPLRYIDDWAEKNAPLILLPFLREHIYGLASRAGIKEVLVPLYVLPSIKVTPSSEEKKT